MVQIYKLKYDTQEQAISDLIAKEVIAEAEEGLSYMQGTHAVVWISTLIDQAGEYNEEGNEITPPTFIDGYHVDIMVDREIDFGTAELHPKKPKHNFAGY